MTGNADSVDRNDNDERKKEHILYNVLQQI